MSLGQRNAPFRTYSGTASGRELSHTRYARPSREISSSTPSAPIRASIEFEVTIECVISEIGAGENYLIVNDCYFRM